MHKNQVLLVLYVFVAGFYQVKFLPVCLADLLQLLQVGLDVVCFLTREFGSGL